LVDAFRSLNVVYSTKTSDNYASAALGPREVTWPVMAFAAIGLVLMVRRARTRVLTVSYLVVASGLMVVMFRQNFQPFRNGLALLPFPAIAASIAVVALCSSVARRWSLGRVARLGASLAIVLLLVVVMTWQGTVPGLRSQAAKVDSRVQ